MLNRVELAHIRELKSSLWTAARVPAEDKTHTHTVKAEERAIPHLSGQWERKKKSLHR